MTLQLEGLLRPIMDLKGLSYLSMGCREHQNPTLEIGG